MTPTRSQTGELEISDKGKAAARKETLRIFHGVRDRDESHYEALLLLIIIISNFCINFIHIVRKKRLCCIKDIFGCFTKWR